MMPAGVRESRLTFAALALILGSFWLRLTLFSDVELGLDGLVSVGMAYLDPGRLLEFSAADVHPPLYPLLLRGWLGLAGESFPTARWLSIAAGILAVALIYRLLAGLISRRVALSALALLSVAPSVLYVSATARDFVVGLLLSVCTWWLLVPREFGGGRTSAGPVWRVLVVAVTATAMLTWYFHAISLAIQLVVFWKSRRRVVASLAIGGLLPVPWFAAVAFSVVSRYALFHQMTNESGSGAVTVSAYLNEAGKALLGLAPFNVWAGWLTAPWLLLSVLGLILLARRRSLTMSLALSLGVAAGVLLTVGLALVWGGVDFASRYFVVGQVFGAAAIAVAIDSLRRNSNRFAALVLIMLPGLLSYLNFQELKVLDGPRTVLQSRLESEVVDGDRLLFDNLEDFAYFRLSDRRSTPAMVFHTDGSGPWIDSSFDDALRFFLDSERPDGSVWWISHRGNTRRQTVDFEMALLKDRRPFSRKEVGGLLVERFRPSTEWTRVDSVFGGVMRLQAVSLPAAGTCGSLPIVLRWQAAQETTEDYAVYVQISDSSGLRVGLSDSEPAEYQRPTSAWRAGDTIYDLHWVMLQGSPPAGNYDVVVGVVGDEDALTTSSGARMLKVGTIQIEKSCAEAARGGA